MCNPSINMEQISCNLSTITLLLEISSTVHAILEQSRLLNAKRTRRETTAGDTETTITTTSSHRIFAADLQGQFYWCRYHFPHPVVHLFSQFGSKLFEISFLRFPTYDGCTVSVLSYGCQCKI
ncbi:hypothetical protein L1987_75490 [Smallanthus sonchifolius]|uniref:Uncharacterized protein n=1 Tax=Smallanthus sonchifolius TaxID=185202 RepID=A0ACB9A683_9ASTR|nr:hypothetical protein L1987_75490 [Smallanthus sonchifolius]